MRLLAFLIAGLSAIGLVAAEWTPENMSQMYVVPHCAAVLNFSVKGETVDNVKAKLLNYSGNPSGTVVLVRIGKNEFQLKHQFPQGFHELEIEGAQQRFGIVSLPEYTGTPDPFFSIETLFLTSGKRWRDGFPVLKRNGISSFREWQGWYGEEKTQGQLNPNSHAVYQEAARHGMRGFFFFDIAPQWTGSNLDRKGGQYQPYPCDLSRVGDSIVAMLSARQAGLDSFQIWNEPDLKNQPADPYISLEALTSYSMKKAGINQPLVGAAFSSWKTGPEVLQPYFDSGMADFIDIFAFHSYYPPEEMLRLIATYRDCLAKSGKRGMPIWITECGKPWNRGIPNSGELNTEVRGKLRADLLDDLMAARHITLNGVEAKAGGIARYVPFTMRFYEETINNFGMTDFCWTPQRSMAAYLFSIQMLSNLQYQGDLLHIPGGVKTARVFSGSSRTVAVLDVGGHVVNVNLKMLPAEKLYAPDGSELHTDSNGICEVNGFAYAVLDKKRIDGEIKTDTLLKKYLEIAHDYRPSSRKASPIVYRFSGWKIENQNANGYFVEPETLEFTAFNLSEKQLAVAPELELPTGVQLVKAPERVVIPANSSSKLIWKVNPAGNQDPILKIRLLDRVNCSAPLCLPFLRFDKFRVNPLEFAKPERWIHNTNGTLKISCDEKDDGLIFDCDFSGTKGGDYWVYPEYILQEKDLQRSAGISFEWKIEQYPGNKPILFSNLMAVFDLGNTHKKFALKVPTKEWTQCNILFPAEWDLEKIKKLRIGMNPISSRLIYKVRNINLLCY